MGREEQADRLAERQSYPCRLLKGIILAENCSKMDSRAITERKQIKVARLKDYEGN